MARTRKLWIALVLLALLVLLAIAAWLALPSLSCPTDVARACESDEQCRLETGSCCDVTDVYNTSFHGLCNESSSAHCQMICLEVYEPQCARGLCTYRVDEAGSAAQRRQLHPPSPSVPPGG